MHGVSDFIVALGAVIAVLIAIGAGLTLVNGSYNKARMDALREDNDDLRKRLDDTERDLLRERTKGEARDIRIKHLESENLLLTQLVTQKADVEGVKTDVHRVLEEIRTHHASMTKAYERLYDAIGREGGETINASG